MAVAVARDFSTDERKKLARSGAAMPDGSYPIKSEQDLKNAIHAYGRAKNPAAVKRHIIKRARALGLTRLLPEGWEGSTKSAASSRQYIATAATLAPIELGNDGALPDWIELIPTGRFMARDGRGPFFLPDPSQVIAATQQLAAELDGELLIDYDHATEFAAPHGGPAPAAGWMREFKVAPGKEGPAIFARVEWTEAAARAIKAKEYRYISPVFRFDKPADAPEDAETGVVMRIENASLTNNPALRMKAVAAKQIPGVAQMANENDNEGGEMSLAKIVAGLERLFPDMPKNRILEIAEEAIGAGDDDEDDAAMHAADGDPFDNETEEQMAARHAEEMARCASDEERAEMAKKHAQEMARLQASRAAAAAAPSEAQIAAMVAKHPQMIAMQKRLADIEKERAIEKAALAVDAAIKAGKLIPAQREWALSYCAADPKGFEAFVAKQIPIQLAEGSVSGAPPASSEHSLSGTELAICSSLGIKHEDFVKNRKARKEGRIAI